MPLASVRATQAEARKAESPGNREGRVNAFVQVCRTGLIALTLSSIALRGCSSARGQRN